MTYLGWGAALIADFGLVYLGWRFFFKPQIRKIARQVFLDEIANELRGHQ